MREFFLSSFSPFQALSALCVAILVDRGLLSYDSRLVEFWPEFGQHGKENVTVEWVLTHRAALAWIEHEISYEDALDHRRMARIFEEQTPNWPPGTATGYHALTYGWLVEQIVRRVDPQHRGLGHFFRDEIALPYSKKAILVRSRTRDPHRPSATST